jgi:hypothetical protein
LEDVMSEENKIRDYYVVDSYMVHTAGIDLIDLDRDNALYVKHPYSKAFEEFDDPDSDVVLWCNADDVDFSDSGKTVASREFKSFDDFAPAARFAELIATPSPYPNLAREVSLWVIPARDKLEAIEELKNKGGIRGQCRIERYLPTFWDVEIRSRLPRPSSEGTG